MRATVISLFALFAAIGAACRNATDPVTCGASAAQFKDTVASFAATVTQVTHETGLSPEGPMNQYAVWVAVSPGTTPSAGLLVLPSTPVFTRANGRVAVSAACAINAGDQLDVWRDWRWAFGAAEAPPGDTLYFATQVVIRR
jgi:hypothetical protein